jgi:hypothetical protein
MRVDPDFDFDVEIVESAFDPANQYVSGSRICLICRDLHPSYRVLPPSYLKIIQVVGITNGCYLFGSSIRTDYLPNPPVLV